MEKTFPQILTDEVARELKIKAFEHSGDAVERLRQCVVMTHIVDDDIGGTDFGQRGSGDEVLLQFGKAGVLLGGHTEDLGSGGQIGKGDAAGGDITFVEDQDELLVLAAGEDALAQSGILRLGLVGIDDPEDDAGLLHLGKAALDAEVLDGIGGLTYAGGVDEAEADAADVHHILYDIAGSAVDVTDYGALLVEEGIEQGGLAGMGLADESHGDAVLEGIAHTEGADEPGDDNADVDGEVLQLTAVGKFEVFVVGEVELEFHQGGDVEELVAEGGELLAEAAAHLVHRHAVGGCGRRGDEVGHGFGLAEVHLSVEKGALGVFARCGQGAACVQEFLQHAMENIGRAMAGDFGAVLAGVGMRPAEEADEHFVDGLALGGKDVAEGEGVRLAFGKGSALEGLENLIGTSDGIGARDADDAYGSAWCRCDGTNGGLHMDELKIVC